MSVIAASPIDSATDWLTVSNVLYIIGSGFTVITALWVLYENKAVAAGKRVKLYLASEVAAACCAFLSLIGSFGAIHFGNTVSHLKDVELSQYQTKASVEIANANKNAENARAKSEEARRDANIAQTNANTARAKAESIQAKAEEARTNSLQAEADAEKAVLDKEKILHDNLELQKQVENERIARLQLERSLAPRNLTKAAQDRLIAQLRPFKLTHIDLVTFPGNPEANNVASQLQFAFEAVGAKVYRYSPLSGSLQGIIVEYDMNDVSATKGATSVDNALRDSGMQQILSPNLPPMSTQLGAYTSSDGATGDGKIRIFVGSK